MNGKAAHIHAAFFLRPTHYRNISSGLWMYRQKRAPVPKLRTFWRTQFIVRRFLNTGLRRP